MIWLEPQSNCEIVACGYYEQLENLSKGVGWNASCNSLSFKHFKWFKFKTCEQKQPIVIIHTLVVVGNLVVALCYWLSTTCDWWKY